MNSPDWNESANDDLGWLIRQTLRENYGQAEMPAKSWERLSQKLNQPHPKRRHFWELWQLDLLLPSWVSNGLVVAAAIIILMNLTPVRSTTVVLLEMAPLGPAVVSIRYEAEPMAQPKRPLRRLAGRHDPVSTEMAALAVALPSPIYRIPERPSKDPLTPRLR